MALHCLETTEEARDQGSGGQFSYGKGHFTASGMIEWGSVTSTLSGSNGITSGIAWAPDEEFIRKDGLTLEQKQTTSVRIVRNRQNDLTRL